MRRSILALIALAASFFGSSAPVRADYILQTLNTGVQGSSLGAPSSSIVSFGKFDSTLGAITGIEVSSYDQVQLSGSLTSFVGGANVNANVTYQVNVGIGGLTDTNHATQDYVNIATGQPLEFGGFYFGTTPRQSISDFASFYGNAGDAFYFTYSASASTFTNVNPSTIDFVVDYDVVSSITLRYDYTPGVADSAVPEPRSAVLLGLGLVACALGYFRVGR